MDQLRAIVDNPNSAPIGVIRKAYEDHIIDCPRDKFDSTLFHFLLRRLAKQGDGFAFQHTKTLIFDRPEETAEVLSYWTNIDCFDEIASLLSEFLISSEAIYAYQNFQIIEWLTDFADAVPTQLLGAIRNISFDLNNPRYLLGQCRLALGKYGTHADLERLRTMYAQVHSPLEKAEIIYSLRNLEIGMRNEFIGRVRGDGDLQERAARLVRRHRLG